MKSDSQDKQYFSFSCQGEHSHDASFSFERRKNAIKEQQIEMNGTAVNESFGFEATGQINIIETHHTHICINAHAQ